jgi:hypothetical protein
VRNAVGISAASPLGLLVGASLDRPSELTKGFFGYMKRPIFRPSESALGQANFFDTERLAVRVPCVLLVRTAVPDVSVRDDQ